MKRLAIGLAVLGLSTATAFAETTTIKRTETPMGESTTVKKENWDGTTTTTKKSIDSIDSTGSLGCETRSVTETDGDESTTKTKTRC